MESGIPLRTLLSWAAGSVLTMAGIAGYMSYQEKHKEQPVNMKLLAYESAMKKLEAAHRLLGSEPEITEEEALERINIFSEEEADAVLRQQEQSWALNASGDNAKLHVFANQVAGNDPNDEYYVWLPLESSKCLDGKYSQHMFAVFDGYGGHYCAEQLQARFGAKVDQALSIVKDLELADNGGLDLNSSLAQTIMQQKEESGEDEECQMTLALKAAFIDMDKELVYDSVTEYKKNPTPENVGKWLNPAVSGSCGIVGILDSANQEITVGNIGDGKLFEVYQGDSGYWGARTMNTVHDVEMNSYEVMRMVKEHPGEDLVIQNGSVLGKCITPRAFGSGYFKWPVELRDELLPEFSKHGNATVEHLDPYISPPYLTANPTARKLKLKGKEKFMVFVSGGITGWLSNDDIKKVLSQWYNSRYGSDSNADNIIAAAKEDNPATAIIRAALSKANFGRYDEQLFRERLTIPASFAWKYRAKMTALVVKLDCDESPNKANPE